MSPHKTVAGMMITAELGVIKFPELHKFESQTEQLTADLNEPHGSSKLPFFEQALVAWSKPLTENQKSIQKLVRRQAIRADFYSLSFTILMQTDSAYKFVPEVGSHSCK